MESYDEVFAARRQWMTALSAVSRQQVFVLARSLAETHTIRPLAVSQGGLALMPLRESVDRDVFYLGEVPLSSSHVEIETAEGITVEGAAVVMVDDADFADALAICDGVLAHRLSGWLAVAEQVQEGLQSLHQEARIRNTMVGRTHVDFSLLNEDDV